MKTSYYLDGKYVSDKKNIPKTAKLVKTVKEEHYHTPEYSRQQSILASKFFERQRQMNEDLDAYHG